MMAPVNAPDPPRPLDDEEWEEVNARASIFPSPEVKAALHEVIERAGDFSSAVMLYERAQAPTYRPKEGESPSLVMGEARDEALAAISDAERLMRDELASL